MNMETVTADIQKVERDGMVAVLYSPGYGAGWYSWNTEYPACIFDPDIVAMVESGVSSDQIVEAAESKWGDGFYAGGAGDLKVMWLQKGTSFRVSEHDGFERVVTRENDDWQIA